MPFKSTTFSLFVLRLTFICSIMLSRLKLLEAVHLCPPRGSSRYDALLSGDYQRDVPPLPSAALTELYWKKDGNDFNASNTDQSARPHFRPVQVVVSLIFLNLALSQTADQILHADVFYYNEWTDDRLHLENVINTSESASKRNSNSTTRKSLISNFIMKNKEQEEKIVLDHCWADKLWVPDIFFRNAVSGDVSDILRPTCYFTVSRRPVTNPFSTATTTISPIPTTEHNESFESNQTSTTTTVFMAVRLLLKLTCHMNYAKFPFDSQVCHVNITATKEGAQTMVLRWGRFNTGSHVDRTEFSITGQKATLEEDFKDFPHINARLSTISGQLTFARQTAKYILKRFIPSFIVVVISFTGFWLPTPLAPARVTLAVTCLLALVTQQIQADLSVSYVYSLQVWNMVCISYVFAALCEYSLALYVMHMVVKKRRSERAKSIQREDFNNNNDNDDDGEGSGEEDRSCTNQHHKKLPAAQLYSSFQLGDDSLESIALKPIRKREAKRCSSGNSGHHHHHNQRQQHSYHHHHRLCNYYQPQNLNHHKRSTETLAKTDADFTEQKDNGSNCGSNCSSGDDNHQITSSKSGLFYTLKCHRLWKHFRTTTRHSAVDNISRYLFPLSYFFFVLVFILHAKSDQQTAFIFI